MLPFPLPAATTAPRHVDVSGVRTYLDAESVGRLAAVAAAGEAAVEAVPEVVAADRRRESRWAIVVEAVGGARPARGWVAGPDTYGLTAVIAADAALRLAAGGTPPGVRAPAEVVPPAATLDGLAAHGVRWSVTAG